MLAVREYNFSNADINAGSLRFEYERNGKKMQLSTIKDAEQRIVSFVHIWINGVPAHHLRKWRSSPLPEASATDKFRRVGDHYYLDFNENWNWLKSDVKMINLKLSWRQEVFRITLPSFYKIRALKSYIEGEFGKLAEGNYYLLFCKGLPLQEGRSLEEYGIDQKAEIEVLVPSDLSGGFLSLQKATGGGYVSIPEFEKYTAQMKEKIGIVCQITIPRTGGSSSCRDGILIDRYLIMTNEHLICDGLSYATAKFFYHESEERALEFKIQESAVCSSKSPGNHKRPHAAASDYAILRLQPPEMSSPEAYAAFQKLGKIAKEMFQQACFIFHHKKLSPAEQNQRLSRANIIQHPLFHKTETDEWFYNRNRSLSTTTGSMIKTV